MAAGVWRGYLEQTECAFLKHPKIFLSSTILGKGRAPDKHGNRFVKNICLGFKTPKEAIVCMAINEDDVCNQSSIKVSSESDPDDLWSSLSHFIDDEGEPLGGSAASQSLLGLSTSLFNDANSFAMDKEDSAEYIPAPAISEEVLPGPMVTTRMDNKLLEAWSFVSDDIKVQDPVICLEGKERLQSWLSTLATTNAHVHLDEIYAERSRAHPSKGFIYALWTLVFPEAMQSSFRLSLSGESKLEVDRTGQVMSVESKWYVSKGREKELDSIKLLLTSLQLKESHNYTVQAHQGAKI